MRANSCIALLHSLADALVIILLMGPAGSGKTTVGKLLAAQLSGEFADGDDFHSPANREKMSRGIGLTDADRVPWLQAIRDAMRQWLAQGQNVVLACSALKRSYRDLLGVHANAKDIKLVYLKGSYDTLLERLHSRKGHYATEQLLASQLADLQEPADAITIDIAKSPQEIVSEIRRRLLA
jgi:gluconokinase